MTKYYGHSLQNQPVSKWEPLEDHLDLVAKYAIGFAEKLNATDWANLLGYWHDLGKYDPRFQAYLKGEPTKVTHSSFGAQHAIEQFPEALKPLAYLLAYCILGHHAGLPDYRDQNAERKRASSLTMRLQDESTRISLDDIPSRIHQMQPPGRPAIKVDSKIGAFQLAFWTRLLFSCLVDADYLATEEFMSPDKTDLRPQRFSQWDQLSAILTTELQRLQKTTPIGKIRNEILDACLQKTDCEPGFFSLTVPTGGGKTLSSLAFALKHLQTHNKDRIIYAIPFTSIVEQTATVFRNLFQDEDDSIVLEHHCNVDPGEDDNKKETQADKAIYASRLATENWDAPLIVTTNVQLLESLFAARPSRCRKLHRIVNSVIILDEAQTLPIEFLEPCLKALQELVTNYGCTIVLCTATQPAITERENFSIGLKNVREIIPQPEKLAQQMKRTEVESLGAVSPETLIEKMKTYESFLCIVNSKPDAARLFEQLKNSDDESQGDVLFHLSTNLCAVHRTQKLDEIRKRLKAGQPCRVISTQLIEAGVDIDFPVVFRSIAGLDSIAQAAGRCNREGKQKTATVYVFEPDGDQWSTPFGYLGRTASLTQTLVADPTSAIHKQGWLSPAAIEQYFRLNYWQHNDLWDKKEIIKRFLFSQAGIPEFAFREVAREFQLIEDHQTPVFIRFDKTARKLLDKFRNCLQDPDRKAAGSVKRKLLRKLQRYSIGVNDRDFKQMAGGDISILLDDREEPTGYFELTNESCYDNDLGFKPQQTGRLGGEQLLQ